MSKPRLIALVMSLLSCALAREASAHSFTVSYNDDCCHETVVDCNNAPGGPGCSSGHRGDDSTMSADFCPLHSCVSLGEDCRADHGPSSYLPSPILFSEVPLNSVDDDCDGSVDECAPGSTLACTTNLRSCSPAIGSATCGANGFPAGACVATSLGDADVCPKAACRGGVINNTDTDHDGLFDCWETEGGIDYDGDGTIDVLLANAHPGRIDLYVEADYFDCSVAGGDCGANNHFTHKPSAAAIASIVQTYANAPIANPDGSMGISLHLDIDEALPHRVNCGLDSTCYEPIKAASFGTVGNRLRPQTLLAKRIAYRYALWAHSQLAGDKHSGRAPQPGADIIITLGSTANSVGTDFQQASTFVHELGHNLGLGHGGGDAINNKPNYLSVMNYAFQSTGVGPTGPAMPLGLIDYSHAALPRLVETALFEEDGIFDATAATTYFCPGYNRVKVTTGDPINWDCLPAPNGPTDMLANADINGDRVCVLAGDDRVLQSIADPGDVVRGGLIVGGPNLIYDTLAPSGDDQYTNNLKDGFVLGAGPNGILDTVPVNDDQIVDQMIWDGPDRVCSTTLANGDVLDESGRIKGSAQPVNLDGFNDWDSLQYDFSSRLHGFQLSGGAGSTLPVELTTERMVELQTQAQVADLTLTQALSRTADGNVVVLLTLVNHGPSAAVGPVINDRLPAGVTFRSCAATGGGTCVIKGPHVAASFLTLASGASATVTITGCSSAPTALSNTASVNSISNDPNPADNQVTSQLAAPAALPAVQQANGSMRYAITFAQQQAYVEAFVRVNGVLVTSGNIVGSRVANADGTSTYSRVVAASGYHAGDVINVRFYAYRSGQPGVYFPGPVENLSYPDFVYGTGSLTCTTGCRPTFKQLANGDVKVTRTYATPQAYVEAFVRAGAVQVGSGNIVSSGVANLDGTFTYTRVVPAASFHNNDAVTFRFYSYVQNGPQVFAPGPTAATYFPGFTYNGATTSDCP